jgi:hypothetical protein
MPWTCPSCRQPIHHAADEPAPHPGIVYRCHVCRLNLVVDSERGKLVIVEGEPGSPSQ